LGGNSEGEERKKKDQESHKINGRGTEEKKSQKGKENLHKIIVLRGKVPEERKGMCGKGPAYGRYGSS